MNEGIDDQDSSSEDVKRGKFLRGFAKLKWPAELIYGVSVENEKQRGDGLLAFVILVNQNKEYISGIEIMLTGYLHRHYTSLEEANGYDVQYLEENMKILKLLEVPFKIVYWKDFCETDGFLSARKEIDIIQSNDESFQVKVRNTTEAHRSKGSRESIEKYLLEEAAYFLYKKGVDGKKVHMTYPADRLNSACTHIMEKYDSDVIFVPYALIGKSKKKNRHNTPPEQQAVSASSSPPDSPPRQEYMPAAHYPQYYPQQQAPVSPDELFISCSQTSILMQRFGIHSVEDRARFFSAYIEKTSQCFSIARPVIKPPTTGSNTNGFTK